MTTPERSPLPQQPPGELLVADIGGSYIRLARWRAGQGCELLASLPTPAGDWAAFCAALEGAVRRAGPGAAALSIAIAGVVSPQTGHVAAANLPCLASRPLARTLAERLAMPVAVTNDAHCAALAEAHAGAGAGHGVVFCAVLGTGVGGGLVVDGRLVRGAGGLAGEWGHGPIVNEALLDTGDGPPVRLPRFPCGCGQAGCLDTVGGARGLERLHAFLHPALPAAPASRAILDAWRAGEPRAGATVRAYLALVSGPLALVVNLTGASAVPVCGGLGRCPELVAALDAAVRRQILRASDGPLVVPGLLGEQAGLVGAAHAFAAGPA
ncbi:MAG: ROK family protein [Roseateles sp.]|uniref:ROK family protein n=1 Tax=Roseateles sp. TaxID=1971397 RepID=UPI0039E9B7FE